MTMANSHCHCCRVLYYIAHSWISFSIRTPYLRKEREEWLLMHIVSYPSFLAVSGTFDTWTVSGCQKSPQSSCMPNNHQGGLIPGLFQLKKKNRFHIFFEMFSNRHFGGTEKYTVYAVVGWNMWDMLLTRISCGAWNHYVREKEPVRCNLIHVFQDILR